MKHLGQEIHRLAESKRLVKREIATKLGMSPSQFNNLKKRDSFDANLLERISKILGVSPAYFFDDYGADQYSVGEINNSTRIGDATVNLGKHPSSDSALYELLAEKERLIQVLMAQLGLSKDIK